MVEMQWNLHIIIVYPRIVLKKQFNKILKEAFEIIIPGHE